MQHSSFCCHPRKCNRPTAGIRKSFVAGLLTSRQRRHVFSMVLVARALGACAGFALATALPGNIVKKFGVSFCAGMIGMIIVIFGNISSFKGAKAAGHVIRSENASPLHKHEAGSDCTKGSVTMEDPTQRKVIRCLLIEPFPESTLNDLAGKMLLENYDEYAKHARYCQDASKRKTGASVVRSWCQKPSLCWLNEKKIKENFDVFHWTIPQDLCAKISEIHQGLIRFWWGR